MSIVKALEFLSKSDVLLASGSPRRLELLNKLDIPCLSQLGIPESVENLDYRAFSDPTDYVLANIANKLQYALKFFPQRISRWRMSGQPAVFDPKRTPDLIVAADTVVVSGRELMEKPKSPEDNARMLKLLRGSPHRVITAVSFCLPTPTPHTFQIPMESSEPAFPTATTFAVDTSVTFANLDGATVAWYVASGEGRDKAGGYAIQGLGAGLIASVDGCFYNVIGFPLNRFLVELSLALTKAPC